MWGIFRYRNQGKKFLYKDCILKFNSRSTAEHACQSYRNDYSKLIVGHKPIYNDYFKVRKV